MLSKLCECASGVLPCVFPRHVTPLGSSLHPYLCPSGQRKVILQMMVPLRSLAWPPHQNYLPSPDPLTLASCSGMVSQNTLFTLVSCVTFQSETPQWGRNKCKELNWKQKAHVKTSHSNMPLLPSLLQPSTSSTISSRFLSRGRQSPHLLSRQKPSQ